MSLRRLEEDRETDNLLGCLIDGFEVKLLMENDTIKIVAIVCNKCNILSFKITKIKVINRT